jgi:two-component system chemotaxis response regulator CheB
MSRIRVLVVDDAVVIRRVVPEEMEKDPELEVVGVAANGSIALAKLAQLNPDLVLLDVEMPVMNGLETLAALRKTHPKLPVIMFSTLTERGALITLDALALGASDYVTKPTSLGNGGSARQKIRDELIPKVKHLCGRAPRPTPSKFAIVAPTSTASPRPPSAERRPRASSPVEVVVVGSSTGGPNALAEVLPALPATFPVPVLIVQHMPPVFTRLLAGRLDTKSALHIEEAATGTRVVPGSVWLAPGDFHLGLRREGLGVVTVLHQAPPENFCRPAVDVLFRDAAAAYGPGVLAVVLTGMGQDGMRGCEAIRAAGGHVIAQDEASSVVWGMPGAVVTRHLADSVLPLDQIAGQIIRRVNSGVMLTAAH